MTKMKTVIEVGIVIGYAALFALAIIGLYCNPDVLSVGMQEAAACQTKHLIIC